MSDEILGSETLVAPESQTPDPAPADGPSASGAPDAEVQGSEVQGAGVGEAQAAAAPSTDGEAPEAAAAAPSDSPAEAPAEPSDEEGTPAVVASGEDAGPADADEPDAEEDAAAGPGPGDLLDDAQLQRAVAALVFASPEPLGTARLGALLERPRPGRVKDALQAVQSALEASGLPLELRQIAGGWRLMTAPSEGEVVARLVKERKAEKLSPAGLETLAVIAYRQPVTKAEIEAIRGVQCGAMLRNLVDRGLARVVGRADVPGSPLQYGTTRDFLDRFGLASLSDLPRDAELLKE
jgi:segregation and condensation protein B